MVLVMIVVMIGEDEEDDGDVGMYDVVVDDIVDVDVVRDDADEDEMEIYMSMASSESLLRVQFRFGVVVWLATCVSQARCQDWFVAE